MHLSSEEVLSLVFANSATVEEFERWEARLTGEGMEREASGARRTGDAEADQDVRGAAELRAEVGWRAQWLKDRALWLAAEPVPLEGGEFEGTFSCVVEEGPGPGAGADW